MSYRDFEKLHFRASTKSRCSARKVQRRQRNLVAAMWGGSCPISMSPPTEKYDVFLSFRGEDTRDNFISHLSAELCRKNIKTFIDYRLDRGKEISPALYREIEQSMIYVIILSEHYASSTWCMDELTKILECKQIYGRDVIPVFYKVDPSNVRNQRESFEEAFIEHQQRFRDKVDTWKDALTQVAGLSGWDSQVTGPEHTLVTDIVEEILKKKKNRHRFLSNCEGTIGMDKHIEQIKSLLHLESPAVRIIGIWGMGGIGKTEIARAIYHRFATQFNSSSMILNVEQEIKRVGLSNIHNKYISELLEEDKLSSKLQCSYVQRLRQTKVLLVLDDVNTSNLTIKHSNFGQGSRIIMTSRDKHVLKNAISDEIYEVKEMCFQDSVQLFSLNAFKQNYPIKAYVDLSEKLVLNHAKRVPLVLKNLGLLLHGRTRDAWESELQKLQEFPDEDTFKVLKLSYDSLDDRQKNMFLDIACFYTGHLVNDVARTLDSCGFSADIGMDVLKDKGLIFISEGRIGMHYLIQKMGHEIVRWECVDDPRNRTRLWNPEEIYHVLKNKGTNAIRCIFLDVCKINKVQVHGKTFKKMSNLRIIQFYKPSGFWNDDSNVILPESLKSLPHTLVFLRWDNFSLKSLPLKFCPKNLVKLDMRGSNLEQLWEGDQDQVLPKLKRLDLSYSRKLTRVPDLSLCPNIEQIILSGCVRLVDIYSSSFLNKLNFLCLHDCVELRSLNLRRDGLSRSSGLVVLYGCVRLELVVLVESLYFLF
ncbi:disease resistance protein (TIR-NBS-LRR class) [Medicago truncatula]|uniref:Disease resistance protein (TIR-NBS-LRR class) n=1 Tax=Medicago truncatula TaxID=3880 RepID=A0A072UXW1_MEDTR|nr:disease resistance protein (TIR-NBS-LRR class) [Medicago truncatula]